MKLIVGLGNPGKEFEKTRHNVGFMVIDNFAKEKDIEFTKKKYDGLYAELTVNDEKVILLKPQTYMNLSGECVIKFVNFFKINKEDILVINDDLDLKVGKLRLKRGGQSAGHNGLKNIALNLNTDNFKRLKVGISNNKMIDTKDYVLGKLTKNELEIIEKEVKESSHILEDFVSLDFEKMMSKYNGLDFTGEKENNELN